MLYLVKYQYYDLHQVRPFSGDSSEGIGNSTVCVCVCTCALLCITCVSLCVPQPGLKTGVAQPSLSCCPNTTPDMATIILTVYP